MDSLDGEDCDKREAERGQEADRGEAQAHNHHQKDGREEGGRTDDGILPRADPPQEGADQDEKDGEDEGAGPGVVEELGQEPAEIIGKAARDGHRFRKISPRAFKQLQLFQVHGMEGIPYRKIDRGGNQQQQRNGQVGNSLRAGHERISYVYKGR